MQNKIDVYIDNPAQFLKDMSGAMECDEMLAYVLCVHLIEKETGYNFEEMPTEFYSILKDRISNN